MCSGVYKITNKENGKLYIGSSTDIKRRWYAHKSCLRRGIHSNKHLQNAWNKNGEDCFEFTLLLEVDESYLLDEEQKLIDETRCFDRTIGYNKAITAGSPMKGRRHSQETIEKIRTAGLGRKHTEESKRKMSVATKGKIVSKETREKMSKAKKGKAPKVAFLSASKEGRKRISEFAKTRVGHKNPNSRLSPEQIESLRNDFQEDRHSISELSKKYNVSVSTIKRVKYGKTGY